MKIGWSLTLAAFVGLLVYLYFEYLHIPSQTVTIKTRKNFNVVTFKLPNSSDPEVFGAPFWKARHTLAELTPCSACRVDAVAHEIFFHDWVNNKKQKPFFDKENFDKWVTRICDLKNKK